MFSHSEPRKNLFLCSEIIEENFTPNGEDVTFSRGENSYRIRGKGGRFTLGKWMLTLDASGGEIYDFSVDCYGEISEEDAYVLLTQYTSEGKMPIREHAHFAVREGSCLRFQDKVELATNTTRLRVELWLKGDGLEAEFRNLILTPAEAFAERRVRVAPVQMKTVGLTVEEQLSNVAAVLERAGEVRADIVILGEAIYGKGLGFSLEKRAENEFGEMATLVREMARKHRMYVVYNTVEKEYDSFYNTSYLFGRSGEVVGKYRKTHLPVTELEEGLSPGVGYPVFELDFGRVGILICYDQFFPRTAEALAMAGAELICVSSIGDMSHCAFARAMENGVYLAVSGANNENPHGFGATRVLDPLGRILADTDEELALALCEIDLSRRVRRFWMSTGPALSDVHDDYRFEKNSRSFE